MTEPLRHARAALFTAVCLLLSASGHALASGGAPEPAGLVTGGGLILLAALRLARRRRGFGQLTAVLLATQAGLHTLFSYLGTTEGGHVHHQPVDPSPEMVATHVLAGLLAAWWLHRGETLAWELARQLVTRLPLHRALALLRSVGSPAGPRTVLFVVPLLPATCALRSQPVSRRGPPAYAI